MKTSFQKTRLTLTFWYVSIVAVILFAFSFFLYTGEQHDFVRIIVQRDFRGTYPRILTISERDEVENQLQAIRRAFLFNLLVVDGLILLIGGGLSYFLAKKTLKPIQETFEKQKTFLADVSHEIRTPLAAIQTATEVSLRSTKQSRGEYRRVLEQVHEQVGRLGKMANDLLLLSRMEMADEKNFTSISLSKITTDAVKTLSASAKRKKIDMQIKTVKKVQVYGDSHALMQLMIIFLDNAIKYTKAGGVIRVSCVALPRPTITVSDTGIGIPEKDIKRIFERFYQADTSRSQPGSGLGLSIAQKIISLHKAKIAVESVVGSGTTFTITFPAV